jgi:sulfur relay (sulfurtransferase) complex TusBCD TusD component (DsrE family)
MRPIRLVGTELLGGQVAFQVVCQPTSDVVLLASAFYASNGIAITAHGPRPKWDSMNNTLYLRGEDKSQNLKVLVCDRHTWMRICKAVDEYNGHYPLCKPERAE